MFVNIPVSVVGLKMPPGDKHRISTLCQEPRLDVGWHDSDVDAKGLLPRALVQLSVVWEQMAEMRPSRTQMHHCRAAGWELAAHAKQSAGLAWWKSHGVTVARTSNLVLNFFNVVTLLFSLK